MLRSMVGASKHHRTAAARTLGQQLARLAGEFDRLAERQVQEEENRRREAQELSNSISSGLGRLHAQIEDLEMVGAWGKQKYFNLFSVIERTRCEHTHSNVLAWLLDPTQAHGLGDRFLKALVKTVFKQDLGQTTEVVVKREEKNCDIVIWRRTDWVFVIENKIDSTQAKDQLAKYVRYWRQRRFRKGYFAFLTRIGEQPACNDFVGVSYRTVRLLLTHLQASGAAESFIRHFADHIWF
jgi:hypothetical protein